MTPRVVFSGWRPMVDASISCRKTPRRRPPATPSSTWHATSAGWTHVRRIGISHGFVRSIESSSPIRAAFPCRESDTRDVSSTIPTRITRIRHSTAPAYHGRRCITRTTTCGYSARRRGGTHAMCSTTPCRSRRRSAPQLLLDLLRAIQVLLNDRGGLRDQILGLLILRRVMRLVRGIQHLLMSRYLVIDVGLVPRFPLRHRLEAVQLLLRVRLTLIARRCLRRDVQLLRELLSLLAQHVVLGDHELPEILHIRARSLCFREAAASAVGRVRLIEDVDDVGVAECRGTRRRAGGCGRPGTRSRRGRSRPRATARRIT